MSLETPTSTTKLPICFDDMFYQCDASDANGNISNHTLSVPHYPSGYTITQIAVASIVVTVLMIVIVVGNMLVIIAISTEKALKNIQNWFIASLAVSDFFLGLIIMPFSLANELMGYWVFGLWWCEIHSAMDVLLSTASIMNLCLISLDRYWSITQAVEYLKKRTPVRAIVMIAAVWVLSALICIPPLLGWKVARPKDEQYPKCQGLRKTDDTWLMFGVTMPVQFEEEEEIKVEEQEAIADKTESDIIDRKEYYEKFTSFQKVRTKLKVLNNLLQRKIALYYKKRLKGHILRESVSPSEWLNYVREYMFKLDTYEKILKKKEVQHSTMEVQIENLRIKKEIRRKQLEKIFDDMLKREIHIGTGLVYKKTGKEISDSLIYQYISKQKSFMTNLSELRAEHIKLKSMVVEKAQAIAKLDKVDNNHTLNRYVKLKEENRIYFDKHEDKEGELNKLRAHSMKTLGCLAHIREQCAAVDNDNEDMNNEMSRLNELSEEPGYVVYSALGSFYIPSCIMVFVYIRIYYAAKARARRGIRKPPRKQPQDAVTSFSNSPGTAKNGTTERSEGSAGGSIVDRNSNNSPHNADSQIATIESHPRPMTIPTVTCDLASDISTSDNAENAQDGQDQKDTLKVFSPGPCQLVRNPLAQCQFSGSTLSVNGELQQQSAALARSRQPSMGVETDMVSEFDPSSSDSGVVAQCAAIKPLKLRLCKPIFGRNKHHTSRNKNEEKPPKSPTSEQALVEYVVTRVNKPKDPEREKRRLARQKEKRATLILGLIMGSFIASWLPFFFMYILRLAYPFPQIAFSTAFWLGYMNSALNPVIYTIFNKDFRRAFRRILFK